MTGRGDAGTRGRLWLSDDGTVWCEWCVSAARWPSGRFGGLAEAEAHSTQYHVCERCGRELVAVCEDCDAYDSTANRVRDYTDAGDAWTACDICMGVPDGTPEGGALRAITGGER